MCRWNFFTYVDCGCENEYPRLLKQCPFRTGFKHYMAAGKPPGNTGAALQRACIVTMKILRTYCAGECKRCREQKLGEEGFPNYGNQLERLEERNEGTLMGNSQATTQISEAWLESFDTELRAAESTLQPDIRELLHHFADAYRHT